MTHRTFRITKEQDEFLASKENASEYIRGLIEREIKKEEPVETEDQRILGLINYKTAIILLMLNEIVKGSPSIDKKSWDMQNISEKSNRTRTLRDAMEHYSDLL